MSSKGNELLMVPAIAFVLFLLSREIPTGKMNRIIRKLDGANYPFCSSLALDPSLDLPSNDVAVDAQSICLEASDAN